MSAEPKFTKGPWRIAGKGTIRAGVSNWIATINWFNRGANAQLIAAAPDLFDALRSARISLIALGGDPRAIIAETGSIYEDEIQAAVLDFVDAALSKALGGAI